MSTPEQKKKISVKSSKNSKKNDAEKFKTTPYVLKRDPRIFDSHLIEICQFVNSEGFMTCQPQYLKYIKDLVNEMLKRISDFADVDADENKNVRFNFTEGEIEEYIKNKK